MIRPLTISLLLAAPAGAATLPAIQIEECRPAASSAYQSMVPGQIAPNAAQICEWPGPPINPLPYDMLADLKGPQDTPPSPVDSVVWAILPVATSLPGSSNVQAVTASASAHSGASAGAFSSSWSEARCGCVTEPETPESNPVPLPAAAWLLMGALGLLWRVRG